MSSANAGLSCCRKRERGTSGHWRQSAPGHGVRPPWASTDEVPALPTAHPRQRCDPPRAGQQRMLGDVEDLGDPSGALSVMAETTGTAISSGTVERSPLSNYGPITYWNRPVRPVGRSLRRRLNPHAGWCGGRELITPGYPVRPSIRAPSGILPPRCLPDAKRRRGCLFSPPGEVERRTRQTLAS